MSPASFRHFSRAAAGAASSRGSSSVPFSPSSPGSSRSTARSSSPAAGNSSIVHSRLKAVWITATPGRVTGRASIVGAASTFTSQNTASHTPAPVRLNSRWTSAARRALRLAPTEDSMAVMQVPMFCPIMMGTAAPTVT